MKEQCCCIAVPEINASCTTEADFMVREDRSQSKAWKRATGTTFIEMPMCGEHAREHIGFGDKYTISKRF